MDLVDIIHLEGVFFIFWTRKKSFLRFSSASSLKPNTLAILKSNTKRPKIYSTACLFYIKSVHDTRGSISKYIVC